MSLKIVQTASLTDAVQEESIPTDSLTQIILEGEGDLAEDPELTISDEELGDFVPGIDEDDDEDTGINVEVLEDEDDDDSDDVSLEDSMTLIIVSFAKMFPSPTVEQASHLAQAMQLEGVGASAFIEALMQEAFGEEGLSEVPEHTLAGAISMQDEAELIPLNTGGLNPYEGDTTDDIIASQDPDPASGNPVYSGNTVGGEDGDGTGEDESDRDINNDGFADKGPSVDDLAIQNDGEIDTHAKRASNPVGAEDGQDPEQAGF